MAGARGLKGLVARTISLDAALGPDSSGPQEIMAQDVRTEKRPRRERKVSRDENLRLSRDEINTTRTSLRDIQPLSVVVDGEA